ncbi:ABC transporter substrate-binding protein [uncultured Methylobacterium sp.]|uniref:ABC transporter substrate-binding protein n=1 Tax=uncultured Methylobacterium sp. TaxID=157278 RepID=UPI00259A8C1E|nr:ABC transporter substrate-binding protein [uncultured Methylobacterium sp.]
MPRRRWPILAVAALLLATTPRPIAAETASVRIGLQYGLVYLPVVVAQNAGLFEKHAKEAGLPGLTVSLSRFSGSTAMNEALFSDSVDLGTLGSAGALIAWDKTRGRQQVKSLAALSSVTYTLYANKPALKSLKDFGPDQKIAIPAFNSPQAILLRIAAEKDLGDRRKADPMMVSLPHPDATAAVLAGQAVAGYFATPPFAQLLKEDARVHVVMTSTDLLEGGDPTAATLAAKQSFVDANPKVAQALLAGLEDANRLIREDPKRAADIYLASETVQQTVPQIVAMLTDGSITYDVVPRGVAGLGRAMVAQEFLRKAPSTWKDVFFPNLGARNGS